MTYNLKLVIRFNIRVMRRHPMSFFRNCMSSGELGRVVVSSAHSTAIRTEFHHGGNAGLC